MNTWLAPYLSTQVLVVAAFPVWLALRAASLRPASVLKPSQFLRLTHFLIGAVLLLPWLAKAFPTPEFLMFSSRHWDAQTSFAIPIATAARTISTLASPGQRSLFTLIDTETARYGEYLALLLIAGGAMHVGLRLVRSAITLRKFVRESHLARRIGRVRVLVHDGLKVPCSFWIPGRAFVVLPTEFLSDPELSRLAILHELQHHRQGDTRWIHVMQALKAVLYLNPLIHFWEKGISTLQEFACDEALVDQKKVSPRAYGSCLVTAAELSLRHPHAALAGTASMAEGASGQTLRRRIEMMMKKKTAAKPWLPLFVGTLAFAALGAVALAGQGLMPEAKLTLAEAQALASRDPAGPFPIVVNEAVLTQLNRFVATPAGRQYMRESIARMATYRAMIDSKLQGYGLPDELLAVPVIESGYRNKVAGSGHGAGIWMFIASTARNYGMRVDEAAGIDERLNTELETDAAMRYLGGNFLRFQDWQLALLAYNAGENAVQRKIATTGSRDAWKLLAAGLETDRNYLPMVMATVLILKNPSLVR